MGHAQNSALDATVCRSSEAPGLIKTAPPPAVIVSVELLCKLPQTEF